MKTKTLILIFLCVALCFFGKRYNYVEHKAYVYKFIDSTKIEFVDRYFSYYFIKVDTTIYNYCRKHRKDYYTVRKYDDGNVKLIN